jgi:hypothetical protein
MNYRDHAEESGLAVIARISALGNPVISAS